MKSAALIAELKSENAAVRSENLELKSENSVLRSEMAEMSAKLNWVLEQLSSNNRKMFGSSSEKSTYVFNEDQFGLFESQPSDLSLIIESGESEVEEVPRQRPKKKSEMGSKLPANIPIEKVECMLPEDERDCEKGHGPLIVIGKEVVRRELDIIPARAVLKEYYRFSYQCKICEETSIDSTNIIKAPMPPQVIKGSMCTPDTLAHIITQKCVMGVPIHRQAKEWERNGIPLNRQTMTNWGIKGSEDYLEPIYDKLHQELCAQEVLQSDSTTFQVLREPGKTPQSESQMWLYRTSGDAENPIVLFEYQPDKKQERPRDFLQGFSGYLVTDGLQSYHCLPDNIIVVGCFYHVRSKFFDALKVLKTDDERKGSLALIGKQFCDRIFEIDRDASDKTFEERFAIRNEKARPVLDEFHSWLKSVNGKFASKSKIGTAITYAINQWKYLERYLLDGRLECNNNRSERTIKALVINRKNFLFATSVAGAKATAICHSLTETAKESGLIPHEYLAHVFRTAAGIDLRNNEDLLISLLPKNAPESCKVLI
jgi:transposase